MVSYLDGSNFYKMCVTLLTATTTTHDKHVIWPSVACILPRAAEGPSVLLMEEGDRVKPAERTADEAASASKEQGSQAPMLLLERGEECALFRGSDAMVHRIHHALPHPAAHPSTLTTPMVVNLADAVWITFLYCSNLD